MEDMAWHVSKFWIIALCCITKECIAYPVDLNNKGGRGEEIWGPALASVALLGACAVLALLGCVCCRQTKSPPFEPNDTGPSVAVVNKEFTDTASNHSLSTAGFVNPLASAATSTSVCTEFTIFPPPGTTTLPAGSSVVEPPSVRFEPLPDIRPRPSITSIEVEIEPVPPLIPLRPAAFSSLAPAPCELLDEPSFPRDRLKYLRELGKGWFGKVVEGEALEGNNGMVTRVAVRILRDDAPDLDQALFLREVASLRALMHPNLLRVRGCCCESQPLLILMDLCPLGDLKSYLVEHRQQAQTLAQKGEITRLMCELTAGLEHMARAGFIHTDLAARNCQLTSDVVLKIGDYGTSIEKYRDEYYCAGDVAVPIRWCAPETLVCSEFTIETKKVTSAANVWTLGIVLWEILQFGQLPHADLTDDEIISSVLGPPYKCLSAPSLSLPHSQYLYHLMKLCWTTESERPSAGQILAMLRHLHSSRDQAGDSSENFEQRWAMLRPNKAGVSALYLPVAEHNSCTEPPLDFTPSPSIPDQDMLSYKSPSLQNLRGSLEDLHDTRTAISLPNSTENISICDATLQQDVTKIEDVKIEIDVCSPNHLAYVNQELFSYQTSSSLEDEDARRINEAIQDLDDALAMEMTSSSEESSRESTPRQKHANKVESSSSVLDFRLQQASASDSEEEATWRDRVERGEFTEKVRQKSRSVQDLMILTHIDFSSAEHSSDDADAPIPRPLVTKEPFKSEGNICGAVVIEGLLDSFRQLQKLGKIDDFGLDSLSSDQSALISPQPIISTSLINDLECNELSHASNNNYSQMNSKNPFVTQDPQIGEFLSSNSSTYLISEEYKIVLPEVNINNPESDITETSLSNTHDSLIGETELLAEENLLLYVPTLNQSRQEIRKTLLLNLDNLDTMPRDPSSSQSCSVTTSTDDSDLTILMNPNLDTPIELETTKNTNVSETPDAECEDLNSDDVTDLDSHDPSSMVPVENVSTDNTCERTDHANGLSKNDACDGGSEHSPITSSQDDYLTSVYNPEKSEDTGTIDTVLTNSSVTEYFVNLDDHSKENSDTVTGYVRESHNHNCIRETNIKQEIREDCIDGLQTSDDALKCADLIQCDASDNSDIITLGQLSIVHALESNKEKEDADDIEKSTLSKVTDTLFKTENICDNIAELVKLTADEPDSEETSAKLKLAMENESHKENEPSNSDISIVKEVLDTILTGVVITTEEFDTDTHLGKTDLLVENNNAKVEKCCNTTESKPNFSSNHFLSLPSDVSKSKINLSLGINEPSSMIAYDSAYPKHHSDHRLRKLKDMSKEYEFSKFKCQEVMKTEPVGMIAFDSTTASNYLHKDIPPLMSPEVIPSASTEYENVKPAMLEPLKLVVERKLLSSVDKRETVLKDSDMEPLSTIAFDFVPTENKEALILDSDVDDVLDVSPESNLDVIDENKVDVIDNVVPNMLVIEKIFKPKRLEELCEEALILDVDESHIPTILEESSMEAIILDVDSTNLAEEICMENPMLDSSSSLNVDNIGAINRLDSLIKESIPKDNLLLKEKNSSWGSGEFKSKKISDSEGFRTHDEISRRITPDDERSSDSDFREKMSLSESGDDIGDKYNLEDIEGELETCGQLGTPSSDSGLERTPHDDLKSFDGRGGEEDEGDEFWKQQMVSLQQAAGKALTLFHEAVSTDLSPCEEEKAYATSWFRRSEEESSPKSSSSTGSGAGNCGDNSYVSFGLDDECVAAIRNELQQKLPKLERQNSDNDLANPDGEEEEIKREDITIHYNIYPAPLSPILEEQESLFASENCSPLGSSGFFLHAHRAKNTLPEPDSLSNSGYNSPQQHSPHQSSPLRQIPQLVSPKNIRSEQFEADIRAALEQCTSVEQGKAEVDNEEEEEEEDVLFINTETNEAKLVESPLRPKLPYLAFVNGQQIYSGSAEADDQQWVEDDESTEKSQAYLEQFDAVTSFSEAEPEDGSGVASWMSVPITRAPMPSPEEEQARGVTDPPPCHTPDWESDTASEDSSSSGEFVWKEGDRESQVKAVSEDEGEEVEQDQQQPCSPSKTFEGLSEFPMAVITEEDEEEDEEMDSASTSSSGTEFVPSSWNSEAAPSRSSLRSPDKKSEEEDLSDQKKNVSFKRQKYHCVYEYPREASDTEPEETSESRRQWGLPQQVDYASFADWELLDDELTEGGDQDTDPDSSEHTKPETFDFYKLSNIDCDFSNGMPEDGEFFISSSARPFHLSSSTFSSQFFPGLASVEQADPISPGGSSGGCSSNSTTPPSPLSPTSMGELRHTRDRLKLDLPKFSLTPITPKSPSTVPPTLPSVDSSVDEGQA